jgi:biopolymer transport protein ExbD
MRIPTSHARRSGFDQTAMTPLIDVVFQLLIFFICATTGHIRELILPADLAAGVGSAAVEVVEKPLGEVWVRLRRDGDLTVANLEGTDYEDAARLAEVLKALSQAAPEIPVILEVAEDVPLGDVVRVYDLCRAGGFDTVSFAVKAPK